MNTDMEQLAKTGVGAFLEFGFSPEDAHRLQAASGKLNDDTRRVKRQLMEALCDWISLHQLKQAQAAYVLMVSIPRVANLMRKMPHKFTVDELVEMLSRAGKPVTFTIG